VTRIEKTEILFVLLSNYRFIIMLVTDYPKTSISLLIILIIFVIVYIFYRIDLGKSNSLFGTYQYKVFQSTFGEIAYMDVGSGTPILVFHGICGGYDQGYISVFNALKKNINGYRIISPSRFGYPGSSLPNRRSSTDQAAAILELLDSLGINKAFVFAISAGGSIGLRFAMNYPQRTAGVILLSSGAPTLKNPEDIQAPPSFIFYNFPMWLSLKLARSVYLDMFGVNKDDYERAEPEDKKNVQDLLDMMLPISNRHPGIMNDNEVTNRDMALYYSEYEIEKIQSPFLIFHAKDDPMALFEDMEKMIERIQNKEPHIFEKGGHLIFGSDNQINDSIRKFTNQINI